MPESCTEKFTRHLQRQRCRHRDNADDEYNGSSVEPLKRLTVYRINSTRKIFHGLIIPSSPSNYQKQVAVLCRIIL